ncbi:MAG: tRNA pseudouridine(55) synthase TruB [candidate division NC10 bacterium]|nr:tRNA pseudouridine(55) synthase TruB [candidate division NC10 bacterium]
MNGVLNINKSPGMTSHDVVDAVRKIVGLRKVGHTGTLDPQATGVLPICVGRATKIAQFLTHADKEYLITMRLGITTDTLDADGKVISQVDEALVTQDQVLQVFARFRGEIEQIPPLFSAKKHRGQRLYRLARRGEEVERAPVLVKVHELSLLELEGPFVRFQVLCSKGTYARALCDDIGRALGCGAHLYSLVRTRSGPFELKDSLTLAELEEVVRQGRLSEVLIPPPRALAHLPAVRVLPEAAPAILRGSAVVAGVILDFPRDIPKGTWVRVLGFRKQLLCVAETALDAGQFFGASPRKVALQPIRVFSQA